MSAWRRRGVPVILQTGVRIRLPTGLSIQGGVARDVLRRTLRKRLPQGDPCGVRRFVR